MFDLQLSAIEQLRVKSPDKFVYEQPVTPQNLINDVMSHIRVDSTASILVLFTVEWALYLRKIGFVDVTVAADNDPIIANACLVLGYLLLILYFVRVRQVFLMVRFLLRYY